MSHWGPWANALICFADFVPYRDCVWHQVHAATTSLMGSFQLEMKEVSSQFIGNVQYEGVLSMFREYSFRWISPLRDSQLTFFGVMSVVSGLRSLRHKHRRERHLGSQDGHPNKVTFWQKRNQYGKHVFVSNFGSFKFPQYMSLCRGSSVINFFFWKGRIRTSWHAFSFMNQAHFITWPAQAPKKLSSRYPKAKHQDLQQLLDVEDF